jgi:hypothetical protein
LASVRQNDTVDINLYAHRSVGTVSLALYFWALLTAALCLPVIAVTYIRRTVTVA